MAVRPAVQLPSMEQFEAYFQRADLDRDGRISGAEAVAFFQGSNLPNQILAQVWMHSDQRNVGFLGRAEFYNALRLVTVAQSGRQLTGEIVRAALEGPATAKIPPPKINPVNTASYRTPSNPVIPAQMSTIPTPSPGVDSNGPRTFPNASVNLHHLSNIPRPIQTTVASPSLSTQPVSSSHNQGLKAPGLEVNWTAQASAASIPIVGLPDKGGFRQSYPTTTTSVNLRPQVSFPISTSRPPKPAKTPSPSSIQPTDNNALIASTNGVSSGPIIGDDVFSASQANHDASSGAISTNRIPSTSNVAAAIVGSQSVQVSSPANISTTSAGGSMFQNSLSLFEKNQKSSIESNSSPTLTIRTPQSGFNSVQPQWPKITKLNIQKYTNVFTLVDKDKDGKITGEEARNLFFSWRFPRDVLKSVWDLSDQDGDGMLSLREFCIALYLMERCREGHPLPSFLPRNLLYDEALLHVASQSSAKQGVPQQGMSRMDPVMAIEPKPHLQVQMSSQTDGEMQHFDHNSGVPILEKHLVNQLSSEEQEALKSKLKEATDSEKKVQELEKEIMELNQKIVFFHTKMQELVIYRSRYDNRLNLLTWRASAEKHELEALTKKYEEKCKTVGGVASKLTAEEVAFHNIQTKKLELFNAIVKMNDGAKDNSILQAQANSIQSDLDELMQGLNVCCKKYGLRAKPTTLVELPFGWQQGIQESAADWDEEWDRFEDEVSGFVLIKELTVDVENVIAPPKLKNPTISNYQASKEETLPVPYSDVHKTTGDSSDIDSQLTENELEHAHSENSSVSSQPSTPTGGSALGSPSCQMSPPKYEINGVKDNQSDHDVANSTMFSNTDGDDHLWGTKFNTHNDSDFLWGFDPMNKAAGDISNQQKSLFGYDEFGLNPIRTGSPSAASVSGTDRPFFDSVPSSPSGYAGFPPRYGDGPGRTYSFSRLDSIGSQVNLTRFDSVGRTRSSREFEQGVFSPRQDTFARFDSPRSTKDSDHSRSFPSFGSEPSKSSESHAPIPDGWSTF